MQAASETRKPGVLIVDDEEEHRQLLSFLLRKDYDVRTASSAEQALLMVRENRPDIVLSDQRMQGGSGVELFASMLAEGIDCLRFLLTAYDDSELLQEAVNTARIYRFVQKPIDPDFLRLDIRRALEHRAADVQVERSAKLAALGHVASAVVHDLRNSLQAITLVPALLQVGGEGSLDQSVNLVRRASRDMTDLVNHLMALIKGEEPRYELVKSPLQRVISETLQQCKGDPLFTDRVLSSFIEPNLPQVALSESNCRRLLLNLLRNAAQATGTGGSIHVSLTRASEQEVVLIVKDDGRGIESDVLARMTEPFFTTKGQGGLGLGLSICRSVMKAHGGRLDCDSTVGAGTTFTARFPVAAEAAVQPPTQTPKSATATPAVVAKAVLTPSAWINRSQN